ncbi:hypothetical protein BCR44DRAFT_164948 [Catenaria anguillulae PL171]|uniref:Uncharacterized protein n=1 Tax=Catenaria anguillulae PL171 TaxID=765915 RepID=A0A1Y2HL59_9FUNG|nr:hypothetical protein BCR44DRAFT_164948 [Catenaria anguillulae PL171]
MNTKKSMENFNIDNFNLPMPVSETELGEFESFVDDFARRMDTILHGNLDDPELDKDLELPTILKKPPATTSSADAAAPAPESQLKNSETHQAVQEKQKPKVTRPHRGIDYSRFETIASHDDEVDGKPACSPAIMPEPNGRIEAISTVPAVPKTVSAAQLLDKAKSAVSRCDWPGARDLYVQVIDAQDSLTDDALRAHANLTLVYLKLDQPDFVVTHADIVLSKDPLHVKALWRKCAALLTMYDGKAWIHAQAELRKAVAERPGELDLVRVVKDESCGWKKLGLVDFGEGVKLESAGKVLRALGAQGVAPILMWLIDHGLSGAMKVDHHKNQAQLLSLHCILVDLLRLVVHEPVTGPTLSKLAPALLAQWIQQLWMHFGSDPAISTFITSTVFSSFVFVLAYVNADEWYLAAATHIRQSPRHSIPSLVQMIHTSSLHIHPSNHTPWSLMDALIACPAVSRDHIVTIATNLLTIRPTDDPPTLGANRINVSRLTEFLKQHGTLRLWSRLTRVPSLILTVSQLIANVSPDMVLASTDTLRAWTVAALEAESVDPTRVLAAVFAKQVDTSDDVIVGNAALLIARAVQRGQWAEKDMEVATKVLLPMLQERAAAAGTSKQAKNVRENLAVALARLCSASPKAREWLRRNQGMELLASVTADQVL